MCLPLYKGKVWNILIRAKSSRNFTFFPPAFGKALEELSRLTKIEMVERAHKDKKKTTKKHISNTFIRWQTFLHSIPYCMLCQTCNLYEYTIFFLSPARKLSRDSFVPIIQCMMRVVVGKVLGVCSKRQCPSFSYIRVNCKQKMVFLVLMPRITLAIVYSFLAFAKREVRENPTIFTIIRFLISDTLTHTHTPPTSSYPAFILPLCVFPCSIISAICLLWCRRHSHDAQHLPWIILCPSYMPFSV